MFTDHKVRTSLVQQQQRVVAAGGANSQVVALGCLLHLLGPVGWILAAILHGGDSKRESTQKTVTVKAKMKVPCCRLCAGQGIPGPVDGNIQSGRFAFEVHPNFQQRLKTMRQESEQN